MRKAYLLLLVLCLSNSTISAVNLPESYNFVVDQITYINSLEIGDFVITGESNLTKDEMFVNIKRWAAASSDIKLSIEFEDRDSGLIIIKWLKPVNSGNRYLDFTATSTYTIDLKDNAYRIQVKNSEMLLEPADMNVHSMSSSSLEAAINTLEIIEEEYPSQHCKIDEQLLDKISRYSDLVNSTPKYKSPKDEQKGKVTSAYKKVAQRKEILDSILNGFNTINKRLIETLEKGIKQDNTFN